MNDIQNMARQLIANLIGEKDMTIHQNYVITEDSLPYDLKVERAFLRAIYTCREEMIAPTAEHVVQMIKSRSYLGITDADKQVVEILQNRSGSDVQQEIRSMSVFINDWQQDRDAKRVAEEIKDIMNKGSVDYAERYAASLSKLSSVSPKQQEILRYTNPEIFGEFKDHVRQWHEAKKSGMDLGVGLPYEGHKAFFNRMQWRELSSIMAETGHGKTMMGLDLAEHNAWNRKLMCDSLYILLETEPERVVMRQFAKFSGIPYKKMDSGEISPDSPAYAEKWAKFEDRISTSNNRIGMIHFVFMPNPTIEDVVLEMERYAAVSKAAKRDLYIAVDYLQQIGYWNYPNMSKYDVFTMFGERVAAANRKLGTHTTMLAQYNASTQEAYGSAVLRKISQLTMLIHRDEPNGGCQEDLIRYDAKDGKTPVKDALGNVRYWHRKGEKLHSAARMEFVKANDAPLGFLKLNIEGAFGRIEQDQAQLKEFRSRGML